MIIRSLGKQVNTALRFLEMLYEKPIVSVPKAAKTLILSQPAARSAVNSLEKLKILRETSGKKRDRVYIYHDYLDIIREGTEI